MKWTKTKKLVVAAVVLILAAGTTTETMKYSSHPSPVKLQQNQASSESFQQESDLRSGQAEKWALALIMFAGAHTNQLPNTFEQAKSYVPGVLEENWEIVSGGDANTITNPAQTILLREREARESPAGKFAKVYAFADGHAELLNSPEKDFTSLEKQRGFLVRPVKN